MGETKGDDGAEKANAQFDLPTNLASIKYDLNRSEKRAKSPKHDFSDVRLERARETGISSSDDGNENAQLRLDTSHALASIGYNSILAQEQGTSSEDEAQDTQIPADDAYTAIGVSISHEQTRLTSPKTPAVEKAAAIERAGGFFGGVDGVADTLVEEPEDDDEDAADIQRRGEKPAVPGAEQAHATPSTRSPTAGIPHRSPRKTSVRMPSPWRVESTARWQTSDKAQQRSGMFDGLLFNRRRAWSGPDSTLEGWQKSLLSSLPSLPKNLSLPSPFSSARESKDSTESETAKPSTQTSSSLSSVRASESPSASTTTRRLRAGSDGRVPAFRQELLEEPQEEQEAVGELARQNTLQSAKAQPRPLRRSTSDQSLLTQRTLSRAESLGDDSRFENVQEQVNSRLKAIKDSWQDSNIRLRSLPNFSMASFTPDFFRERSASFSRRTSVKEPGSDGGVTRSLDDPESHGKPVDPMTRQPYTSAKAAVSDTTKPASHPHFHRALEQLEGDVVVLGGYRGSILRSAEPPHRQFWVPVKVGLNLRKVNLEVGIEEGDDERATEKVIPGGMLTHIGPVDIARRLLKRLRSCPNARNGKLRVHDYGYDWRLDPNHLSKGLIKFLEDLPCNKPLVSKGTRGALVIAHSLGGLVTRHAVNRRTELFKGVVYAGVPNTCVNILGPLRNGDEVLLSNRVLTAQVNFTIRTSFALMPLDGRCFFDKETREEYPVDFFDPQTWIDYRLSPCVGRPLPPLSAPQKSSGITGYVSSMASALPSLPGRGRKSSLRSKYPADTSKTAMIGGVAEPDMHVMNAADSEKVASNNNLDDDETDASTSVGTAVTIPREKAIDYLTRMLASVKKFKQELAFEPSHAAANAYPPIAVIYGKSTPTVYGAKVDGREGIKHADAYDELAFASGDGVVLARAAMAPSGYTTTRGGVVSSERGHVTLLSDLEAVGKCLNAVLRARSKGTGLGVDRSSEVGGKT